MSRSAICEQCGAGFRSRQGLAGHVRFRHSDGIEAGVWDLPAKRTFFGESSFIIPGELVTQNRTVLRFELIPGKTAIAGSSFFYWILVPGDCC